MSLDQRDTAQVSLTGRGSSQAGDGGRPREPRKTDEGDLPQTWPGSGAGPPEPSLEGEQEPARASPAQQTAKGADVVSVARGSDRTPVSRDKLQPQEGSLVCWDSELELHSVGNERPVESFN